MKSIEERAYDYYASESCPRDCEHCEWRQDCLDVDDVQNYITGAYHERNELLKWNNPFDTDGLEDEVTVLLKVDCKSIFSNYILGSRCGDKWLTAEGDELPEGTTIVGWRNIEEL